MKRLPLTLLAIALAATTLLASTIVVLPPIPGSMPSLGGGGLGGRQAPPIVRVLPPMPPPPSSLSTAPPRRPERDDVDVVVRRVTIQPGEHVTVTAGPGALMPGETLLDGFVGRGAEPMDVLVAVVVSPESGALPAMLVERR